jgi:hypothetical protein
MMKLLGLGLRHSRKPNPNNFSVVFIVFRLVVFVAR